MLKLKKLTNILLLMLSLSLIMPLSFAIESQSQNDSAANTQDNEIEQTSITTENQTSSNEDEKEDEEYDEIEDPVEDPVEEYVVESHSTYDQNYDFECVEISNYEAKIREMKILLEEKEFETELEKEEYKIKLEDFIHKIEDVKQRCGEAFEDRKEEIKENFIEGDFKDACYEIEKLRNRFQELEKNIKENFEAYSQEEIDKFKKERDELKHKIENLENECMQLKQARENLDCQNIETLRNELVQFDEKIRSLKETASEQEIENYKIQREEIKHKLEDFEQKCNLRDKIEDNKYYEGNVDLKQEMGEDGLLDSCKNIENIKRELENFEKKIEDLKETLSEEEIEKLKNRLEFGKNNFESLKKLCELRFEREERKEIITNYIDDKKEFLTKKDELVQKYKNGELTIEELKQFMIEGLEHELERVELYKAKLNQSNFPKKELVETHLERLENKINEYIEKVNAASTKEELIELGRQIKKAHDLEVQKFAYFNAIVATDNYDQIIEKVENLIEKIETKYELEDSITINRIKDKLEILKTKINNLDKSVESYSIDNIGQAIKDFKLRNEEIKSELKTLHQDLKDLKEEIITGVEEDFSTSQSNPEAIEQ